MDSRENRIAHFRQDVEIWGLLHVARRYVAAGDLARASERLRQLENRLVCRIGDPDGVAHEAGAYWAWDHWELLADDGEGS
jgi:hypothetical protein